MNTTHELTTTEPQLAAADAPLDPRLIQACGVLIEWLMEQLEDPAQAAELLDVDKGV